MYMGTKNNPFLDQKVGKVMTEITAQTEQKKTVLEKLKDLLRRGRLPSRKAE